MKQKKRKEVAWKKIDFDVPCPQTDHAQTVTWCGAVATREPVCCHAPQGRWLVCPLYKVPLGAQGRERERERESGTTKDWHSCQTCRHINFAPLLGCT